MSTVLLYLFFIRKVFLEGTSKKFDNFFTVQRTNRLGGTTMQHDQRVHLHAQVMELLILV